MSTRDKQGTRLTVVAARRLVSLATRAPSVHNTQPWAWRIGADGVDLYTDESRRMTMADPQGRNLVISCGAALHHLQVAASASGWQAAVTRLPEPADPSFLAAVRLSPAAPSTSSAADLRALRERHTDRRRFTSWPLPDERIAQLAAIARERGAHAIAVTDPTERFQVNLLVGRALQLRARDLAVVEEQRNWTHHEAGGDGMSPGTLPGITPAQETDRSRLANWDIEEGGRDVQSGDGLVMLCATEDTPLAWLRAGEGLSALWLHAAGEGISVVPMSQVVEVPETRAALQYGVLGGMVVPLLLVRVGWQAISRSELEPTPRRPLDEVLRP